MLEKLFGKQELPPDFKPFAEKTRQYVAGLPPERVKFLSGIMEKLLLATVVLFPRPDIFDVLADLARRSGATEEEIKLVILAPFYDKLKNKPETSGETGETFANGLASLLGEPEPEFG